MSRARCEHITSIIRACYEHPPLKKGKGNWAELFFAKTSGTVTGDRGGNWPIADRRVPISIPETIAGCTSAPIPFSVLKRQMTQVCYEHDASILRALGEQVTSMMRACHGIGETILRARCKHVTSTMQACHKHLASMLQAQCENITSVMQACIEQVMT